MNLQAIAAATLLLAWPGCASSEGLFDYTSTSAADERRLASTTDEDPATTTQECFDDPDGWVQNGFGGYLYYYDCEDYVAKDWCTPSGGYGSNWVSYYGNFDYYANQGIDASEACCDCGGGSTATPSPTPATTPAPTATPSQEVAPTPAPPPAPTPASTLAPSVTTEDPSTEDDASKTTTCGVASIFIIAVVGCLI